MSENVSKDNDREHSDADGNAGLPNIDDNTTDFSDKTGQNDFTAGVEEKKSPNGLVVFLIVSVVFASIVGAGFFGFRWLLQENNSQNDSVTTMLGQANLQAENVEPPLPVNTDSLGIDEYQVSEPEIKSASLTRSEESNSQAETETDNVKQESQEPSKIGLPSPELMLVLEQQRQLIEALLAQQKSLLRKVESHESILNELHGRAPLLDDKLDAVVKSNEAVIRLVKEVSKQQASLIHKEQSKQATESLEKELITPEFIVKMNSIWGEEVTVLVELKGGFYRNVSVGGDVDGWTLESVDLARKLSNWRKGNVVQTLKIG
ncbi:hypothetical protein AB9X29_003721 [Vibrio vulnificus]